MDDLLMPRVPTGDEVAAEYAQQAAQPRGPVELVEVNNVPPGLDQFVEKADASSVDTVGLPGDAPQKRALTLVEAEATPSQLNIPSDIAAPATPAPSAPVAPTPTPNIKLAGDPRVQQVMEQMQQAAASAPAVPAPPAPPQPAAPVTVVDQHAYVNQMVPAAQPVSAGPLVFVTFIGDFGELEIPFAHVVVGHNCIACYSLKDNATRYTPSTGSRVRLVIDNATYNVLACGMRFDNYDNRYRIDVYPILPENNDAVQNG